MQNVGLVVVVGDIQSIASGIYIPISLCWSGFPLNRKVRRWAVVVSVFCAGWQRWHSTTVNHAESCWRQLWCFYQGESYLWYWLKIMIKYKSRQNTITDNEVGNYVFFSALAVMLLMPCTSQPRSSQLLSEVWSINVSKRLKYGTIWLI